MHQSQIMVLISIQEAIILQLDVKSNKCSVLGWEDTPYCSYLSSYDGCKGWIVFILEGFIDHV